MNSCLYECKVYHKRLVPRPRQFQHRLFLFYLDLDELDRLPQALKIVSHNRFNFYNFCDADHLEPDTRDVRVKLEACLLKNGISRKPARIMLLTHLRTLGHLFNPVSFYFCFDAEGRPFAAVSEVSNTFYEMKVYVLGPERLEGNVFKARIPKHFYISPFLELDLMLDFHVKIPGVSVEIRVNDMKENKTVFLSGIVGTRRPMKAASLWRLSLLFPFVTLKVIGLIHLHAFLLYLKKTPFFPKHANPELQREVIREHSAKR